MKADRIAGVAVIAAGVGLAVLTANVDTLAGQRTLSARFFPYLLAAVLAAGGIVLALRPGDESLSAVAGKLLARRGVALAALFLLYALTFRYVDFRLGTWAFVLASMWILGSRSLVELLVTPVLVSLGVYALFRYGFTVLLPTWT